MNSKEWFEYTMQHRTKDNIREYGRLVAKEIFKELDKDFIDDLYFTIDGDLEDYNNCKKKWCEW